jgi:hypothetical protein
LDDDEDGWMDGIGTLLFENFGIFVVFGREVGWSLMRREGRRG